MPQDDQFITLTADIVAAHLSNNTVAVGDVANLISQVHGALTALGAPAAEESKQKVALVSVRASVRPDYIVCMECGSKQKMLKRHLAKNHDMTPDQYRADYGLPRDYPMVAPNYAEQRRALAHSIGLGRKKGEKRGSKPAGEGTSGEKRGAKRTGQGAPARGRSRKPAATEPE